MAYQGSQMNSLDEKTDEELVSASLKNQNLFALLIKRYEAKLKRYVKRISSFSDDQIEDILQEIFIKVYRNLNDFDTSLKFSSWIYRISHNEVINHVRKMKARPQTNSIDDEDYENFFPGEMFSDEMAIHGERKKEVREVLSELDPKYNEVLILNFMEGKSYKEISDILKKPMGTVATLINRAKKKFAEEYMKKYSAPNV